MSIEKQRLIFQGKLLKDEELLSDYKMESGDVLHLVVTEAEADAELAETESQNSSINETLDNLASIPLPHLLDQLSVRNTNRTFLFQQNAQCIFE